MRLFKHHSIASSIAFVLLIASPLVAGQSVFGHPWAGFGGFNDFYDFGSGSRAPAFHGYGQDTHRTGDYDNIFGASRNDLYDDYFGYQRNDPCPRYRPMQLSGWQGSAGRQLVMQATLPEVKPKDMEAWLSSDGTTVYIRGRRALSYRGRTCLPEDAQLSADGRHEILEAAIPVPAFGNGERANVRQLREGLRIFVPRRSQSQPSATQDGGNPAYIGHTSGNDMSPWQEQERSPQQVHRQQTHGDGRQRSRLAALREKEPTVSSTVEHTPEPRSLAQSSARPVLQLPPSTGIEVEDEDFPWPEKDANAAEGWWDNRGEFQHY